jgi:salicylate hydroxylase
MRVPLLIAGGGIGGLAAALALARRGRPAHVLEKAPQFAEIGAGLQLAPNATRVLDALGILDDVLRTAVRPRRLVMRDAISGDVITALDLGERFLHHFGFPYVVMHRNDLLQAELAACRASGLVTLETNRTVAGVEDLGEGARVTCADGSVYECDALVGADGLHSVTRRTVHDDGEPVSAAAVAYRCTLPFSDLPAGVATDDMTIFVGPDVHFVQYIVRRNELLNQVAVFRGGDGSPEELDGRFAVMCARVRDGVARLGRDRHWAMFDRLPIPTWTRNHITLLGDAAHPMLQYAAQGACQALEDALALGDCVAAHDDPPAAFHAYEARRLARASRVQQIARWLGDLFHLPAARAAERRALVAPTGGGEFEHFDWLYGSHG